MNLSTVASTCSEITVILAALAMLIKPIRNKLLGLDKTDAQVALIQNAKSSKMGKKDVLKIATDKFDLNLDAVAYLAPHTTVNVICGGKAAEKQALRLPEKLVNMVHCPNPACISNHEQVDDVFTLVDPDKGTYRCLYCETAAK